MLISQTEKCRIQGILLSGCSRLVTDGCGSAQVLHHPRGRRSIFPAKGPHLLALAFTREEADFMPLSHLPAPFNFFQEAASSAYSLL
ncbi:hypothetical protein ABBQ32_006324 [Trebouxia sp. C0010 RCD-2024]